MLSNNSNLIPHLIVDKSTPNFSEKRRKSGINYDDNNNNSNNNSTRKFTRTVVRNLDVNYT
jgi:hypothetical protein